MLCDDLTISSLRTRLAEELIELEKNTIGITTALCYEIKGINQRGIKENGRAIDRATEAGGRNNPVLLTFGRD